jgi:hypothetical protein
MEAGVQPSQQQGMQALEKLRGWLPPPMEHLDLDLKTSSLGINGGPGCSSCSVPHCDCDQI